MIRPVRTLLGLGFFAGLVWLAFSVELGAHTFVEHLGRIGETPEARALIDGTRTRVDPLLDEVSDRVVGERVEAPTRAEAPGDRVPPKTRDRARPSTAASNRLPGQPSADPG